MKIVLLLSVIVVLNCASVKPYQKEHMADPIMAMDGDLAEDYHESHWLATREAGPTAANTTGGGCACN